VRAVAEEAQPPQGDRRCEFPGEHSSLDQDRKGGQRQTDRRDAGRRGLLGLVADETVLGVGLVEVVLKRAELEPIQVLLGQHVDGVVLGAGRRFVRNFSVFFEAHQAIVTDLVGPRVRVRPH